MRLRFLLVILLLPLLLLATLLTGPVDIPASDVLRILSGGDGSEPFWRPVIMESRLPMAVSAVIAGAVLSAAGLLMQTLFRNPLAGPSVMGVSSGASLGVAVVMLGSQLLGFIPLPESVGAESMSVAGAFAGAIGVTALLSLISTYVRNGVMLLIAGIMIGYVASSLISILNFFAPAEGVKSYLVWGLGSFSGVRLPELPLFALLGVVAVFMALPLAKPLDALLLGERYAASMGHDIRRTRSTVLVVSGFLTATATAYCGPIGFIGLIVPHICRIWFRSALHSVLLPGCVLMGSVTALFCAWLSILPAARWGVIPINVITPVVGLPIIIHIIAGNRRPD